MRADDASLGSARSAAVLRLDDVLVSVGSANTPDPPGAVRDAIAHGGLDTVRCRCVAGDPRRPVLVWRARDPDLLTLRGRRELAAAEVVVVDRWRRGPCWTSWDRGC